MNYFSQIALQFEVPDFDASSWPMAQVADVPDRARYKYTLWEKEIAPPTPLHVFAIPEPYANKLLSQLPRAVLDREVPGVFYMKMEKPHQGSTVPPQEFFEANEETKILTSQGKFIAKEGEAWLLNVSKPHAVRMSRSNLRSCISFSFRRLRFSELVSLLPTS